MANVHKTPVERCETTRLRGRSARTWVCSIEIDLDKRDCEDTDWSARSVCQIQRVSERSEVSVPRRSSHKQDLGQGTFRLPTAAASGAKALQNQNVLCLWPARCTTESGHPRTQAASPHPVVESYRDCQILFPFDRDATARAGGCRLPLFSQCGYQESGGRAWLSGQRLSSVTPLVS
jgi:hypothetical protein